MLWIVLLVLAEFHVLVGEAMLTPDGGRRDKRLHPGGPGREGPSPEGLPAKALPASSHVVVRSTFTEMADTLHSLDFEFMLTR